MSVPPSVPRVSPFALAACLLFATTAFGFNTVVIDAGHGGKDRGGIPGQRISEKALTLDVARRLRADLREAGLHTVMTRTHDAFVSLQDRVAIANAQRNAVLVSIHFNAATRGGASGIETYYFKSAAAPLAMTIQTRLLKSVSNEDNRGVKPQRYYVLRKTQIPAVLVECGFLTNGSEGARCLQPAHRQRLADAIASAIETAQQQGPVHNRAITRSHATKSRKGSSHERLST